MGSKIFVREEITLAISNGYTTLTYPTGVTNTDYFLPIIQPVYASSSILGWTGVVQKNGDSTCYIYVRQGTTKPSDNSTITFTAIWIHK